MIADVVVDLQYGDCGKGKVAHHLCREGNYTHVIRYNGGCNAGHTIFHEGVKFVTHHIPCGVFFGVKSVIGPGCVVNVDQLFKEIRQLQDYDIDVSKYLRIASNAHVITDFHLAEDKKDTKIGTTKRGNGPAYRDKYARRGVRAVQCPELAPYVIDMYTELYNNEEFDNVEILFELLLLNPCLESIVFWNSGLTHNTILRRTDSFSRHELEYGVFSFFLGSAL